MTEKEQKWDFHEKRLNLFYNILKPQEKHTVEDKNKTFVERIELNNGMWTFYQGKQFPYPGAADEWIVEPVDTMKKNAMALFWGFKKLIENRVMGFLFLLVFRKQLEIMAGAFFQSLYETLLKVEVREERFCRCVRELRRAMAQSEFSKRVIDVISMVLEFDSAYRFRFQWAIEWMQTFTYDNLIAVLLEGEKRESDEVMKAKWRTSAKILKLIKFHKPTKQKVERLLQEINKKEVVMWLEDAYWAEERNPGNYFDYQLWH